MRKIIIGEVLMRVGVILVYSVSVFWLFNVHEVNQMKFDYHH